MILHFDLDLDLEDSKPIVLEDSLAHADARPYQVWQYKVQHFRRQHLDKQSLTFCNFAVTLTLNTAIQFLHKTLWLTIMYHQTKFCSKRTSNSEIQQKLLYFDHTSPCRDLDLENSNRIFLHVSSAHYDASQYRVWKQNVLWFRKYHMDKHRHFDPQL